MESVLADSPVSGSVAAGAATPPLMNVKNLIKRFPITSGFIFQRVVGHVHAVEDVSFEVAEGETLGLVGESGCGKTTIGRCVLQLHRPTSGSIRFMGTELTTLRGQGLQDMRRNMQIVFQDPYASLNPRMTVGTIVGEPLTIHHIGTRTERKERVRELLHVVGLNPQFTNRYPHEFSGGQRQRIGLARALALHPKLIICDEPVSALDVSIQAQMLNLLQSLQEELNLTYLFIAHDLSVVKHVSDRVAVMYLGKVVEIARSGDLYRNPLHPYTFGLLAAIPIPDPKVQRHRAHKVLEGDVPSPTDPPPGCVFHPRCFRAQEICRQQVPPLVDHGEGHQAACFFPLSGGEV
ncbi:MAG: ATP-binding cassette domain-containing protein [Actinobacteria bacterium]|nr:ATP-binding cassette domain-containing protein [Actinomycetota bacterium]